LNDIKEEEKKSQLLFASVGPSHYNNLASLLGPEKPLKTCDSTDLISSFMTLLSPAKSVVLAQHYCFSCYQTEVQSIVEYVAT
jgi:hypothetical protein